jgi:phosphate-selective porin
MKRALAFFCTLALTSNASAEEGKVDDVNGFLWLRAPNDAVTVNPTARVQLDTYAFAGPGVSTYQRANGTGLKLNTFFRRFVLEMNGTIRDNFFYWLGGNFAPTTLDGAQNSTPSANVYDGFIGWEPLPNLRFVAGQFNMPFTMENVTSSRWLDFMERSLTVRAVGAPSNKDIGLMAWGELPNGMLEGMVGVFGGDGMNRFSVDNRVDLSGRVVLRPLVSMQGALRDLSVGGSFRYGSRDPNAVLYDTYAMSTPGGFQFWSPVYGKGVTETHVIAAQKQVAGAAELYVPIDRFDLRSEVVFVNEGRREAFITELWNTQRFGHTKGISGYVQLSFWPLGTPRVNGRPGTYTRPRPPKDGGTDPDYGLEVALRGELVRLKYQSNDGTPNATPGELSADTDTISVNAYQFGVTYWATKHLRFTGVYSLYHFPGTGPAVINPRTGVAKQPDGKVTNQASAPGARAQQGDGAPDFDAHDLHEVSFRIGLVL